MKKLFFSLFSVATLGFGITSCNETKKVEPQVNSLSFIKDEVNNVQSYVISNFMENIKDMNATNRVDFINSSIVRYSETSNKLSKHTSLIQSVLEEKSNQRTTNEFNEQEQSYLNAMESAFNLLPDTYAFQAEYNNIKLNIETQITDLDRRNILLGIHESSLQTAIYWVENKEAVYTEMSNYASSISPATLRCTWSWGEFGKEVIKGAGAGGIGGAVVGGSVSAGTLTIPGWAAGALGGAAGGAASYALGQLWDCLF